MKILETLQNEFNFLGKEKLSGHSALKIIEKVFKEAEAEQLRLHGVLKPLPSKDAEFIYSLLPEWSKEAPKGLDPTMYGTNTQEGDQKIVDRVKEILK